VTDVVPEGEAGPLRPVRPNQRALPDGRRAREVLTYARRGGRLTPSQQRAWDAWAGERVIGSHVLDDPDLDLAAVFGRRAPLVVEIGCGVGEATGVLAAARPEANVLGLEVWKPGLASALAEVADADATNVRFAGVDAVWFLEQRLAPASVSEVLTFFPDPWPKTKHHKRRLVGPAFAALVADRLVPGGAWRLATDWPAYAERMRRVLDAEPALLGGEVERWGERPVTKFERKGRAAGRPVTDLAYVRRVADGTRFGAFRPDLPR